MPNTTNKTFEHFTLRVTQETMAYFRQFPSPSKKMRAALHEYAIAATAANQDTTERS